MALYIIDVGKGVLFMKKMILMILVFILLFSAFAESDLKDGALVPIKKLELDPVPGITADYMVYAAPDGDDTADGTGNAPVLSIARAVEIAGEYINSGSVVIKLGAGEYSVYEPIVLDAELLDGANGHTLIFAGDGNAVISGGMRIENWNATGTENVWAVNLPDTQTVHGFYVDGKTMEIAAQQIYGAFTTGRGKNGIVSTMGETWNNWQNYAQLSKMQSVTFTTRDIYDLDIEMLSKDTADAYFLMTQTFRTCKFEIGQIENNDDFNFSIILSDASLKTIDYGIMSDYDMSQDRFYICNSFQLLDREGEYCFDSQTRTLYYYTEDDPNTKDCRIPVSEGFMRIEGTRKKLASGVRIDGIAFKYGMEPVFMTHPVIENQSDSIAYAYIPGVDGEQDKKGRRYMLPGMIYMNYASDIVITNCDFTNMETVAIQLLTYVYNVTIDSCRFDQMGGSAIECGKVDENTGYGITDHNPLPENYTNVYSVSKKTNFTPYGLRISNNCISNCGLRFVGGNGIMVYYANHADIIGNTIHDINGTGISVGWGWGNNTYNHGQGNDGCGNINIIGNYIKSVGMKTSDCGGIYTLGFFVGEGCYVGNNFIDMKGTLETTSPAIYLDEGSDNVYVTNNLSINSRLWLSARALPLTFNGSVYENTGLSNSTLINCIVDGNYTNKASGTKFVYANYTWPGAETVAGANFILTEEIFVKNWKEVPETAAIAENAGCAETVGAVLKK